MNYKDKTRYTKKDEAKQKARLHLKYEEFKLKSLDELKELYNTKMSSTDRLALIHAADCLNQKKLDETMKLEVKEELDGE